MEPPGFSWLGRLRHKTGSLPGIQSLLQYLDTKMEMAWAKTAWQTSPALRGSESTGVGGGTQWFLFLSAPQLEVGGGQVQYFFSFIVFRSFLDEVTCSPGYPSTQYIEENDLQLFLSLLPLPPKG